MLVVFSISIVDGLVASFINLFMCPLFFVIEQIYFSFAYYTFYTSLFLLLPNILLQCINGIFKKAFLCHWHSPLASHNHEALHQLWDLLRLLFLISSYQTFLLLVYVVLQRMQGFWAGVFYSYTFFIFRFFLTFWHFCGLDESMNISSLILRYVCLQIIVPFG